MEVLYEDNHLIIVNKSTSEIVQGDKTGDTPLSETLKVWLKEKYHKPGNVFVGVTHRLDRPVSGIVVFAKTSKALARLNEMFRTGEVKKTYWAIVQSAPEREADEITHYLVRNEKLNKSVAWDTPRPNAKEAVLAYRTLARSENYTLLEVSLKTGRHHQIRCKRIPDGRNHISGRTNRGRSVIISDNLYLNLRRRSSYETCNHHEPPFRNRCEHHRQRTFRTA